VTGNTEAGLEAMKHNEQARVAPLDLVSTYPFRAQKNTQHVHRAHTLAWCVVRLLAVVGLSWLARSIRLDPSARARSFLNAREA